MSRSLRLICTVALLALALSQFGCASNPTPESTAALSPSTPEAPKTPEAVVATSDAAKVAADKAAADAAAAEAAKKQAAELAAQEAAKRQAAEVAAMEAAKAKREADMAAAKEAATKEAAAKKAAEDAAKSAETPSTSFQKEIAAEKREFGPPKLDPKVKQPEAMEKAAQAPAAKPEVKNPEPEKKVEEVPAVEYVRMETTLGAMIFELDAKNTPKTVQNFMHYVETGFFENTIFHRVIADFMAQGGSFLEDYSQKTPTAPPIENEASPNRKNEKYTLAMARTNDPHSATAQFFINAKKNDFLDQKAKSGGNWGYCVFGKVIGGQKVADAIFAAKVIKDPKADARSPARPVTPIKILKATKIDEKEAKAAAADAMQNAPAAAKAGAPNKVRCSHILAMYAGSERSTATRTKEEALALIEEVQQKLKDGGDFAQLAREYSDCPSKRKGGDLGPFGRGMMAKPFEETSFALEVGQVSGIVTTSFGYHIIMRTE